MSDEVSTIVAPSAAGSGARRRFGQISIEVRRNASSGLRIAAVAIALLVGLGLSAVALVLAGVPADSLADEFIMATLFDPTNFKAVLFQASPLILVGLCAAMAFRVRFWNLGIEGQMIFGGIGATIVSLLKLGPDPARLYLMALAAMICGALWAFIPALLKLRLAVNEIISTLLLNYVAYYGLLHLLYGPWKDQDGFPHSPSFAPSELLPTLSSGMSVSLLIAVAAALLMAYVAGRSRAGIFMRFVSANPSVARALGVPVGGMVLSVVLASGALAALAGFTVVSGQEGRLTQSFFEGYGVSGVLIGFLARNNPIAAAIVAFLMSVLFVAGQNLQVFYSIPSSMVQLIQAVVVMCVAASDFLVVHRIHWIRGTP
ncbi:ABC transporter permease [Segnochrobactrum spirostomi]|uniref:ABC transporter permease n=1 Tax=Segnochrobactrum spirostomi TaxID=2608987 RepID=A0A6A7Y6I7_9HYPH|nr:ABC transporter permease [Segnochrobactrum spirostomi]MQT14920.1 ABC transporter permease [Segnochrobactrum spirostomi]